MIFRFEEELRPKTGNALDFYRFILSYVYLIIKTIVFIHTGEVWLVYFQEVLFASLVMMNAVSATA